MPSRLVVGGQVLAAGVVGDGPAGSCPNCASPMRDSVCVACGRCRGCGGKVTIVGHAEYCLVQLAQACAEAAE